MSRLVVDGGDGSGGGSSSGTKVLPTPGGTGLLVWDFQKLQDASTPVIGLAPGSPYISTGTAHDTLSSGFNSGHGGALVEVGPGGPGLVYAADFFASGGDIGGLSTADNPTKVADNTSLTLEVGVLVKSLVTNGQGTIFSKAYNPAPWGAPFNAVQMTTLTGNNGFIQFGMVDSSNLSTEIGCDTSDNPRSALTVGYHWLNVVVDEGAKLILLYQDGALVKSGPFTTGIALGTGPWLIGGNKLSAADAGNFRFSRCAVYNVAKTAAQISADARGFLAV